MINKKGNFKPSAIGLIPEDWEVVRLGEVVEIYDHKRIPLSEMERSKRKGKYPYCGANGIIDFIDDHIFDGEYVLLAEDGGDYVRFGRSAYIMSGKFWVNNHAHVLKAMEGELSNWFLMYSLNFLDLRPYIVGSTRTKLNQDQMKNIKLPLPPLPEQKRIAEVLRTVDEAIEKVEQEIEHTERLKKGLMQHLLTRGIGHTRFKDSPLGKIPESWDVVRLGEIVYPRKDSIHPQVFEGEVYVGLEHIEPGEIYMKRWGDAKDVNSLKFQFNPGDILYGKLRPYLDKAVIATHRGICSTDFIVMEVENQRVSREFLIFVLHSIRFIRFSSASMKGTNHPRTSWNSIKKFQLPLPPLPEQKKIAEILMTVDRKIELLKNKKEHLERLKKGLMNDLLTGRRRLKVVSKV